MEYSEAKQVVKNFFDGISQPVNIVCEALDMVSERDFTIIQNNAIRRMRKYNSVTEANGSNEIQ